MLSIVLLFTMLAAVIISRVGVINTILINQYYCCTNNGIHQHYQQLLSAISAHHGNNIRAIANKNTWSTRRRAQVRKDNRRISEPRFLPDFPVQNPKVISNDHRLLLQLPQRSTQTRGTKLTANRAPESRESGHEKKKQFWGGLAPCCICRVVCRVFLL